MSDQPKEPMTRGQFLNLCGRTAVALTLGGVTTTLALRRAGGENLWQIDPNKCIQCGQCATHCVLDQSAVRCFHAFRMCGYCELCTGFFEPQPNALNEGAENQACPVGAIQRRYVTDPYFEYQIDEEKCTGCAQCVKGCRQFGNGSLYLQVRRDLCMDCNHCAIAENCPADAFVRVPASRPYISPLDPVT